MTENLEKAKKLFFDNSCSPYFMARDGADSEFRRYGGTKELEEEWRKEYIATCLSNLSLDNFDALHKLNHAWGVEALPGLSQMCNRAEGYAKLEYADVIWQLAKSSTLDEGIRQQARKISYGCLAKSYRG